jgi:hypothetical protein
MKNKRLAVIIPYRDRQSHLEVFVPYMEEYLKEYEYKIFVIEQSDDKPFNRGKLLNVGAKIAIKEGFDYFALHDVDMLPLKGVDYSYPDTPIHLVSKINKDIPFMDYFGGVTLFNVHDYKLINGYSNEYWGWGFEDDDLLYRCIQRNIPLDKVSFGIPDKNYLINYFKFDGKGSYIKIPYKNLSSIFNNDFTISVKIKPEDSKTSLNANFDEYQIVSIPGRNTGISYTSFKRYKGEIWTKDDKSTSIQTEILNEIWAHLVITKTDDEFCFYMNGELIDKKELTEQIFPYNIDYLYLGAGNPTLDNNQFYFKGLMAEFAIWNIALDENNIKDVYENSLYKSIVNDFKKYNKSKFLKCYYDFKNFKGDILQDLSGNKNNGLIYNCEDDVMLDKFQTDVIVPIRREGKFKTLKHTSNSTIGNNWVHSETRKNQERFYNEMKGNVVDLSIDGLNTCVYKEIEREDITNNAIKIKVNL